jgi:hypothetical protein
MSEQDKNWKLKLRYGKLTTIYKHFTTITKGVIQEESEYSPGNAFMAIKIWATTYDDAADLVESVAEQIGFVITGQIEVFDTEPQEPPKQNAYGYDLGFTYFQE